MAITNRERVGKALDLLRDGLGPFVQREFSNEFGPSDALDGARAYFRHGSRLSTSGTLTKWDSAALLSLMVHAWGDVFRQTLGHTERSLVSELLEWRNKWAHQHRFSSDDAERALDSAARLLTAVSANQADEVARMRSELRRLVIEEQTRREQRKAGGSLITPAAAESLRPWREVVTPHADVARGLYQQAEFAADLWQVHLGEGADEYRDPAEFFRRTFLTESLRRLLVRGVQRLTAGGGDPVVQLQTNFGGGKTHSMLALYHLFSGVPANEIPGVDAVMAEAGVSDLPAVRTVVLVGNKISPGSPVTRPDGTVVHTLWGEIAYQLGGPQAYARVAADDRSATNPGDTLRQLFNDYGPCLILIDEWVAYARQLHDAPDLPGGTFETQFTFAQALTEAARAADRCLLLISLPASESAGSPHAQADDVEVGGVRGREALERLRNVVGRVESSWRAASAEEGFEIVRRRLFEPLAADNLTHRDLTARAFSELYQAQQGEFPNECRTVDYERRIRAGYPIHPEVFDRLYTDWSTLVKFQRTRGVLRLMASVIHSLWEKGDRNPLILPSMVPIDDSRVQFELTRYLSENWVPIIEGDVDGPSSLPLRIDGEVSNLGKLSATRRVARTIYMGSAPTVGATQRGIEDRRVKLGCVIPGESPQVFGDAIRRLAAQATYLYQDGPRYWYSTQPTVTKLAEDRALQLERDPDKVHAELKRRLEADLGFSPRNAGLSGDFARIHLLPRSGAEVPDEQSARLVVLDTDHDFARGQADIPAEVAARAILDSRGSGPRIFRNSLVFLAADRTRLQDLDDALRRYLAWDSILEEKDQLNLDPYQVRQAENQHDAASGAVVARLPETYQWVLTPRQSDPSSPVEWQATRLTGSDPLAVRAARKLRADELLVGKLGSVLVRRALDDVPLWRGDHVPVRTLVDDFAQQLYLQRLDGPAVLADALRSGVGSLTWQLDTFAYAESFDEAASRYLNLQAGRLVDISPDDSGLIVKPDVAQRQLQAELDEDDDDDSDETDNGNDEDDTDDGHEEQLVAQLRRYHGSVKLDPTRVGRDAGKIAEEIVTHLVTLADAEVTVTIEIEANLPQGATDHAIRTVTENSRTLNFHPGSGFERD
ncbi:MAG: Swt1 family HEPN domain-containing protein [Chloroflexi bacterium]|nr:Swt1 family HEPN domain-containing protein [Chloroflexota bacterium]